MSASRTMRVVSMAACAAASVTLAMASGAAARPVGSVYLCVPAEAGATVQSGGATGECKKGSSSVGLPSNIEQQEKLLTILKHVTVKEKGVDGKPTIVFSGANVQVVAGTKENETTGLGNLVVGNDENPGTQTGSNNLIMGSDEQSFTSFGSILGGSHSGTFGSSETVLGFSNKATGPEDSVTGGKENTAESINSSVSGGIGNRSIGDSTAIAGGNSNVAEAGDSVVLGGAENEAKGNFSTVLGELGMKAENEFEVKF
jgi:hypothetical protein